MPMPPGGGMPLPGPPPMMQMPKEPKQQVLKAIEAINLAKKMDEMKLNEIGAECKEAFDADDSSREQWMKETEEWLAMARQLREKKTWPWMDAANVKYPLVSIASLQFAARAYPSLVPNDGNIVKMRVIGTDKDGEKTLLANRTAKFMSWQLVYEMPRWEEDTDRLLTILPVIGTMFRKTYFDKTRGTNVSEVVYPENFVVDYWTRTLEEAERYSEILYVSPRKLKERQRTGEYLKVELGEPTSQTPPSGNGIPGVDKITPYKVIAQATWLDIDDDGVDEPYTVVFHYESGKVLRIVARYTPDDVIVDDEGELIGFKDRCIYTKYSFIPNPDGGFYDLGFGHLLGPINESVNTLINQLLDAGTLANLQAGFVGKGLRLKMGDTPLRPGEWRAVNAVGDDIRKQMVPIPAKEPSAVLFQLMGSLISAGEKLASVAEIFTGKMPGQNTPATTTMATIEQGMKVFTAVYKRIYRSMEKEFKILFYLNGEYLNPQTYVAVLDDEVDPSDFNPKLYDICPAADPQASSQTEQLMKSQALLELLPIGTLDPIEVTKRVLTAQQQPDWEKLIPGMAQTGQPQIPQKPDPKMMEMQMKMQMEGAKSQLQQQGMAQKFAMEQKAGEAKIQAQQQESQLKLQSKMAQARADAAIQQHKQKIFMAQGAQDLQLKGAQGVQKLQQDQAKGQQQLQLQREKAKSQPTQKTTSQAGKKTR
jgi:chaperonin GroES